LVQISKVSYYRGNAFFGQLKIIPGYFYKQAFLFFILAITVMKQQLGEEGLDPSSKEWIAANDKLKEVTA